MIWNWLPLNSLTCWYILHTIRQAKTSLKEARCAIWTRKSELSASTWTTWRLSLPIQTKKSLAATARIRKTFWFQTKDLWRLQKALGAVACNSMPLTWVKTTSMMLQNNKWKTGTSRIIRRCPFSRMNNEMFLKFTTQSSNQSDHSYTQATKSEQSIP